MSNKILSDHEQSMMNAFLGTSPDDDPWASTEAEADAELEKFLHNEDIHNEDPPPAEDIRKELIHTITEHLSFCASYHIERMYKLLSVLSNTRLRYLIVLLEELTDSEINEKHWQETKSMPPNLAALSGEDLTLSDDEMETDFRLAPWPDDDDSFTGESTGDITRGVIIAQTATPNSKQDLFAEPPTDKERWSQSAIDLDAT